MCPTFCLATMLFGLGYLIGASQLGVLALELPCFLCPLLLTVFEAVKMALDYNARVFFPKWVAGVPWLSVAMAVLICESQQPTVLSQDFRAVEPLEKLLFGLWERIEFV